MGHEASGVVAEVGSQVGDLRPGERITFDSMVYCGQCHYCRGGLSNLCDQRRVLGVSCGDYRRHGAFAEYLSIPRRIAYRLPDSVSFEHAAMVEPISVVFHAVNLTPLRLGDSAVVVGSGMIGLLALQALRRAGCGKLIAVDLEDAKLALARKLGADHGLNPKTCDVPAEVRALTGGRGADVALEAVGATAPVETAVACLRKGGALTLVGNLSPRIEFPLQSIVTREIRVNGSCGSAGEYPACLEALERGAIQVDPLISAAAPLEEGPSWFDRLHGGEKDRKSVV